MKRKGLLLLCIVILVMLAAACGGNKQDSAGETGGASSPSATTTEPSAQPTQKPTVTPAAETPHEPVVLTMLGKKNFFEEGFANPLHEKYPYMTLNLVTGALSDVLASGSPIDIIYNSITVMSQYENAKMTTDITDLAKKQNIDLTRFYPETLDSLRLVGNGKLIGLPHKMQPLVMYYNKDIFDKFNVPYPTDDMTWEETQDLAKKLTIEGADGTQYYGLTGLLHFMLGQSQLPLNFVDPQTNKVTFETDPGWKKLINAIVPLFQMPGYDASAATLNGSVPYDRFIKDRTAAMFIADASYAGAMPADLNWDVVTEPVFEDYKDKGPMGMFAGFLLSSTSKHPEDALRAIDFLTSVSLETQNAKPADLLFLPTVTSKTANDAFASDAPALKGKNLQAFISDKYADPVVFDQFYASARNTLRDYVVKVITGELDVNTALRQAAEVVNAAIEKSLAAK